MVREVTLIFHTECFIYFEIYSFYKIDTSMTVKEALEGKTVIEYPIFHIVLSGHFSDYPTDLSSPSKYFSFFVQSTCV